MVIDHSSFRKVLGSFVSGVTVVTTLDQQEQLNGMTASSFKLLSLSPPLVLFCVANSSRGLAEFRAQGRFAVHILRNDQHHIARKFADQWQDRTQICAWSVSESGLPIFDCYHGVLECRLYSEHKGGDHSILVGEVMAFVTPEANSEPLAYYRGEMFGLAPGLARPVA